MLNWIAYALKSVYSVIGPLILIPDTRHVSDVSSGDACPACKKKSLSEVAVQTDPIEIDDKSIKLEDNDSEDVLKQCRDDSVEESVKSVEADEHVSVSMLNAPPIAPPPPPPEMPRFSSGSLLSSGSQLSLNADSGSILPRFKHCPLTLQKCNPKSIFARMKLVPNDQIDATIAPNSLAFRELFGIAGQCQSSSSKLGDSADSVDSSRPPSRRDSGYSDVSSLHSLDDDAIVKVLDDRRSYSLDLMLKQSRMKKEDIVMAVSNFDDDLLGESLLNDLVKYAPNETESALLQSAAKDNRRLSPPDSFAYQLSKVTFYQDRLISMNFMKSYRERFDDALGQTRCLSRACQEIEASLNTGFANLLNYSLTIAIHMNSGRPYFHADSHQSGFKVSNLLKLCDVKPNSLSPKGSPTKPRQQVAFRNLLEYVCTLVPDDQRLFFQNWHHISKAAELKDVSMRSFIKSVKKDIDHLRLTLEKVKMEKNDGITSARLTLSAIVSKFDHLRNEIDNVKLQYRNILVLLNEVDEENSNGSLDKQDGLPSPEAFFGSLSALKHKLEEIAKHNQHH